MTPSVLSKYVNAEVLGRIAGRRIEPRGLALGNLAGAHRSPLAGFAVEFAGHREYVVGDDPKHIDWRVYFTRDKYFVKQYEMETNFVCHLLLDASASMRYGQGPAQKFHYAARMAATLAHAIVAQRDKVSLATFDERVLGLVRPSNSPAQLARISEHLDRVEIARPTRLPDCVDELLSQMGRREIVMLFSDCFTDLERMEQSLQRMRYARHEVVLFHVLHADERQFAFDGQIKFVGLESAAEYLTQPSELRAAYLQALQAFTSRLAAICHRNQVECVAVDTSRDMGEVFVDYLNHRSALNRGR